MHHSRLGGFAIDCRTDDLEGAAAFWTRALGLGIANDPKGAHPNYVSLERFDNRLDVEVQRVDHPSRVHLDIETDDVEAEVRRIEGLGARRVAKVHDWWVLEAPTGQRFCVVPTRDPGFAAGARRWE